MVFVKETFVKEGLEVAVHGDRRGARRNGCFSVCSREAMADSGVAKGKGRVDTWTVAV